jgi:hypothetical protein
VRSSRRHLTPVREGSTNGGAGGSDENLWEGPARGAIFVGTWIARVNRTL